MKGGRKDGMQDGRNGRRADGRKDGRTRAREDGRTEERKDGRLSGGKEGRKGGRLSGRKEGRKEKSLTGRERKFALYLFQVLKNTKPATPDKQGKRLQGHRGRKVPHRRWTGECVGFRHR